MQRPLSPLEARVLGVLVEKQHTVPDTYPLSLNALTAGCNQKTARQPVMEATEAEVLTAVDALKAHSLVFEGSSSRVVRYEHNLGRIYRLEAPAQALVAVLMLRGPQTAAELRLNAERLHRFVDIAAVDAVLTELAERFPPRAAKLARAPGAREARWMHLLSGEPDPSALFVPGSEPAAAQPVAVGEIAALKAEQAALRAEQAALRAEVQALREQLARLAAELGVSL